MDLQRIKTIKIIDVLGTPGFMVESIDGKFEALTDLSTTIEWSTEEKAMQSITNAEKSRLKLQTGSNGQLTYFKRVGKLLEKKGKELEGGIRRKCIIFETGEFHKSIADAIRWVAKNSEDEKVRAASDLYGTNIVYNYYANQLLKEIANNEINKRNNYTIIPLEKSRRKETSAFGKAFKIGEKKFVFNDGVITHIYEGDTPTSVEKYFLDKNKTTEEVWKEIIYGKEIK